MGQWTGIVKGISKQTDHEKSTHDQFPPLLNLLIASHSGCQFLQVSVVDNDSQDGSVKTLQTAIETEDWGDWVTLIPSDRNGGYAYGNNLAIRPALASSMQPDYVL